MSAKLEHAASEERLNGARDVAASLLATPLVPLFLSAVLFGVMAVGVRVAARDMGALQVAFFRFAGSFLVLLVTGRGRGLRPRPGNLPRVLLRGLIGGCAISLYFVGIAGAGAGLASLLQSTYPVFAALLASALLGERFTARLATAIALNFAGALLVLGFELRLGPSATLGMLAALGAAVLSGGAIVTARHLRGSENATLITTYFMAVGAVLTSPSLAAGLPAADAHLVAALAVVVLTSVAAQWLLHHALGFVTAAQASLVAATGVVTAATLEAEWFGETLHPGTIAGGTLMLVAVYLASRAKPAPVA
ncbi:MAG TPA: DMT family transporter [Candidatus Binatia bacterium]|nr:DMT family transporter [Candidatus Binatia bacterium]